MVSPEFGIKARAPEAQRQHVWNELSGVLFGHGIETRRQDASIESLSHVRDPGAMEMVKRSGLHSGPIVNRHSTTPRIESSP